MPFRLGRFAGQVLTLTSSGTVIFTTAVNLLLLLRINALYGGKKPSVYLAIVSNSLIDLGSLVLALLVVAYLGTLPKQTVFPSFHYLILYFLSRVCGASRT